MDVHGRDLRYFAAVAQELHFTRAAELLFVSQPALSKQVRMLEREVGAALFERGPREVRLTEVGEALLPHALRILDQWDAAQQAMAAAKDTLQSRLVVGMSTSPGRRGMLPAIRSRFSADCPQAQLALRQVDWTDPSAGLADGSCDVAFVWLPQPAAESLRWLVLAEEPRLVALPETHPLASGETVDFGDLLDEPFLALPSSAGALRDYWLADGERNGAPPLIGTVVNGIDETYEALVAGQGVCLLAAGNAPLLTRDGVVTLRVRGLSPSRFALAWRADDSRPLVHAYVQAARAVLAESA